MSRGRALRAAALGAARPHFPVHHGAPLATIGEKDTEEHEEAADEAEGSEGVLGLVRDVEVGNAAPRRGNGVELTRRGRGDAIRVLAVGAVEVRARRARGDESAGGGVVHRLVRVGGVYPVAIVEVILEYGVDVVQVAVGSHAREAILITEFVDCEGSIRGAAH